MICPSCKTGIRFEVAGSSQVYDLPDYPGKQVGFDIAHGFCPECSHLIVLLRRGRYYQGDYNEEGSRELTEIYGEEVLHPQANPRTLPPEVPSEHRNDFLEASAVLSTSTKASAALSRRLLQQVLQNTLGIRKGSLDKEIDEFLARPGVPSHLAEAVHAVRQIGNFAAHPIKDQHTGEILPVEPGEAEWLLDVLESLLDYVFVQPERLAKRKEALNRKLAAAGKPVLKQGAPNPAPAADG